MEGNKFLMKLENAKYDGKIQVSEGGVEQVATKMYLDVLEGRTSAIAMVEMLKFVEQVGTKVNGMTDDNGKNSFKELVRDEIVKNSDNGKSCTTKFGTKLELAETGTTYNFTACGDPVWDELNKEFEKIKAKKAEREKFLKTISEKGLSEVNEETGEVTKISPPIKTSTSSFKQTLLKD